MTNATSKKVFLSILLCTVIGLSSVYAGEIRINTGKTEINYTLNTYEKLSFTTTISAVQFRDVQTKQGLFTELFIQGYGNSNTVGDPKLPVFHRLVEIPLNSTIEITFSNVSYSEYDLATEGISNKIIPAQAPVSKNIIDPDKIPFIYNAETYQKNEFLGQPLATVKYVGIMRSVNLARLDVSPILYNPVTKKIRVFSSFDVIIHFKNGNLNATLDLKTKHWSPYFENSYQMLANYKSLPDSLITSGPVTYVIVSDPLFHNALQPFIQWKTKKGYKVIQAYTNNPAVGNTNNSIRNYLMGLYNTPPQGYQPPTFVLFVGDVAQIPAWTGSGHPSDLNYCEYTNDNLPEVYCGRFSAQNITQLQPYIDKTLEYEQYAMPNDAFLGEVTGVAGADADHQLTYGNGQINYGTTYYFNTSHNILSHTYLQPMPSGQNYSQDIRNDVSNGEAYSNYTAHGSEDGWADPQFSISQIPALQNDHKYCLMVGNCCKTANFSVNCFAEETVRAAHKCAVGYIGCSDYSYWDEDYWWGVGFKAVATNPSFDPQHLGAYDVIFHDQGEPTSEWATTMAQMMQGGDMAVEESGSSMNVYYWETYTLMGDPSLSIYLSIPSQLTATYQTPMIDGTTSLMVTTEPNAYIGLSVHDTVLLDAKCADASGVVNLSFSAVTPPDTLDIIATKQFRKPYIGTIPVIPSTTPFVILSSYTVDDSIGGNNDHNADFDENIKLNVTVHNIGSFNAGSVTGTLSTSDTNVIITSNTFNFGPILAGGSVTGNDAYSLTIKNNVQDQHSVSCSLILTDGSNTWNSTLVIILNAPHINITGLLVQDPAPGGNGNGVLDPGESATLKITVINNGHAPVNNGIGHLLPISPSGGFIIIQNPDQYLGTLPLNGTIYQNYNVIINGITPLGTVVNLANTVTAGGANQYSGQKQFDLVIGQIPQYNMSNGSVTTCNAQFFDSGGPQNDYSLNEDFTMTFSPGTAGAKVKAAFTAFDIESETTCSYDYLSVYDGPNTTSVLIGKYCGTDSPGTVTATTTSGDLTFKFHSDYSLTLSGWSADIQCSGGPLTLIASAFPTSVCLGNSSQLSVIPTGGSGNYTYLWSPATYLDDPASATPVSTPVGNITYTVTVNDGFTNITSSPVILTVLPVPQAPVISEIGSILTSSANSNNQWFLNGALIPGATTQNYTPNATGDYYAKVYDAINGCLSDPSNIITILMTGISEKTGENYVQINPNPFTGKVTINYTVNTVGKITITLFDSFGKEVKVLADGVVSSTGKYSILMNGDHLTSGVYYCKVQTAGYIVVKKLILSK
ncbi:MAG: C25 family cysteine peptidase [Bacteroidetes bacterium]|nr:C25 family cysteine peptidase [Bacteroidota bacterium]